MEVELKTCPFCGSDKLRLYTEFGETFYNEAYDGFIECRSCGAEMGENSSYNTQEEAAAGVAELWNKRPACISDKTVTVNIEDADAD